MVAQETPFTTALKELRPVSRPVTPPKMPDFKRIPTPMYRPPPSEPQSTPDHQPTPKPTDVDWKKLFADTEYVPDDFNDINVEEENRNPRVRREKQEILFQLLKMYPSESKGQWNMKMPLFELKYELLRREQFKEEQEQIAFMKQMMKMILTGIEMGNEKFGPFLELKGWSREITKDMSQYDRCLKALYHRYFRRKQINPVMELMYLIVGSAAMWHIQSKFLGGPPVSAPGANSAPPVPSQDDASQNFFNNIHDIKPPPGSGSSGPRFPFGQTGTGKGPGGVNLASLLKLFVR